MFANVFFDIILVGILLCGVALGIKNGFVDTVARPIKFVFAIAMAVSLAASFGSAIIEPIIGPAISHKIADILIEEYSEITAANANESLPTLIKLAAIMCGVDITDVASSAEGISVIEAVADAVTTPMVEIISTIFGFIAVYFLSKLLFSFGLVFVNSIVRRGVVGGVNRALGSVFGLFFAFVIGWAFTSVIEFFFNIPVIASANWVENFTGGPVYNFFKSFTPLDRLLSF